MTGAHRPGSRPDDATRPGAARRCDVRPGPVVCTTGGRVRGLHRDGAHVFHAIPYAAPPVGAARFAAPGPAPGWHGVRDATRPGPTAPAPVRSGFGGLDLGPVTGPPPIPGDAYLTVTVTTPDPGAGGLPVLVFVHGGGFLSGTGQAALYDGGSFARDGVVLVTLNYRLGIPGWLTLPGAPENRGLLDVLAALRWVADNAAAFGGDPQRVTVAGQSAGAMIVAALLAAPPAAGLFRRAISQSGNGLCAIPAGHGLSVTRQVAAALGLPPRAEAFHGVDDTRLADALGNLPPVDPARSGHLDPSLGNSPFKPVIDGVLLERQPALALRTAARNGTEPMTAHELLIGTNADEAALYTVPGGAIEPMTTRELAAVAARRSARPEALLAHYGTRLPDAGPGERATRLMTDVYRVGNHALADAHSTLPGTRTFAYEFAWRSPAFDGRLGACHCVELPFVFDRTDLPALHGARGLLGPGLPDGDVKDLAARTHAAWVAFATHGDPGWRPYDTDRRATMRIDHTWQLHHAAPSPAATGEPS
ncbi:carboxylesterase/lipase family protein [Streptomyces kronopolitis]|uniref:carboxylesterase/lipase family protein n=1 Tax=Streptomyces kronopolitis TaxID=1612435 RepID=UPI0020BF82F8|nr:carboxylesterase family protein [Streptomyces kronopolitis]MCL6298870.1 carboxylesterase family protein [Streptomyces kronopolitis]